MNHVLIAGVLNDLTRARVPSSTPRSTPSSRGDTLAGGQGDRALLLVVTQSTPPKPVGFVAKSYRAAGQAAASLHAMAILQVYQARMVRDMHEGRTNQGLFDELCTAHSMGQAGLFGGAVEDFAQQLLTARKQTEAIKHIRPQQPAAASTQPSAQNPQPARRPPGASSSLHLGRAVEVAAGRRPSLLQPRSNPVPETGCSEMALSSFQEMVAGPLLPPVEGRGRQHLNVSKERTDTSISEPSEVSDDSACRLRASPLSSPFVARPLAEQAPVQCSSCPGLLCK
ncbi:hypothetical protein PO909_017905 [Leuciscus waleckii]